MTVGLYLLFTTVLLLFFALWIRGLIVRRLQPDRILAELREEISELVADLNQTGDHNISLIEDRIGELRRVVTHADRQIEELSELLAQHRRAASVLEVSFGNGDAGAPPSRTGESHPASSSPSPQESASSTDPSNREAPRSAGDRVRVLHRQGMAPELIAAQTGIAIGEVELIISLTQGGRSR